MIIVFSFLGESCVVNMAHFGGEREHIGWPSPGILDEPLPCDWRLCERWNLEQQIPHMIWPWCRAMPDA